MIELKRKANIPTKLIEGSAYLLGDYVDADAIIPVRYCTRPAPEILVKRCLTQIDPDFLAKAAKGVIVIAGKDFGRGSANENSIRALQLSGVRGVIAASCGLLFKRNAVNLGLPVMECPELVETIEPGDKIEIDLENWRCANVSASFECSPVGTSAIEKTILTSGGAINWMKINNKNITQEVP